VAHLYQENAQFSNRINVMNAAVYSEENDIRDKLGGLMGKDFARSP
jgi:hypothetical protein